jgi:hypothetical protein
MPSPCLHFVWNPLDVQAMSFISSLFCVMFCGPKARGGPGTAAKLRGRGLFGVGGRVWGKCSAEVLLHLDGAI